MISPTKKPTFYPDWIQQIPSSIAVVDTNFKFVSASPLWLNTFGFTSKEIENKDILNFFPSISQELKTRLSYSLEGLKGIKIIHKISEENSSKNNYVWNLNPWKDGYGNIIGVTIKVESVSKTQELEIELSKTKLLLNQKEVIAKIGSWEFDVNSKELIWTPVVNNIYGVPKNFKPTIEKAISSYKKGKSRDTITKAIRQAKEFGTPWNENLELVKEDGTTIWVNTIGRPKYTNGVCNRIIGTVQDITKTVNKETTPGAKLVSKYPLFEHVSLGMFISDMTLTTISDINKPLLKLLDIEKSSIINKSPDQILGQSFKEAKSKITEQLKNNNSFNEIEFDFKLSKEKTLRLSLSGTTLSENSGEKNVIHTIKNITESTEREAEYKKIISSSNEKNEQLVNFAHMVSHNLKAHATNFSLLLNFLNEENGQNEREKLMTMLFNASDNLADTIKGLREIVEIETTINQEKRELSINESIFLVEQNVMGLLKESGGKIINEIPDAVKVKALPAYLQSILTNCITNSIKYKQEDKNPLIILSHAEDEQYHILSIEDNGIGIDLDKFGTKLFGLYNTFHKNKNARGIGLYITKNQIEAMNGKISVSSKVGHGSTFKIYFTKN